MLLINEICIYGNLIFSWINSFNWIIKGLITLRLLITLEINELSFQDSLSLKIRVSFLLVRLDRFHVYKWRSFVKINHIAFWKDMILAIAMEALFIQRSIFRRINHSIFHLHENLKINITLFDKIQKFHSFYLEKHWILCAFNDIFLFNSCN